VRRFDHRAVPAAGRSSGLLPHLLLGAGAGRSLSLLRAVTWDGDAVVYLDQRLLPVEERYERAGNVDEIVAAIQSLAVRGAPCIGIFGAYGIALLRATITDERTLEAAVRRVREARPTAVNLRWAVDRVLAAEDPLAEARAIHSEQISIDAAIADAGLDLVGKGAHVLTHCNTGPIATAGGGTAVGVIIGAHRAGKKPRVYVDETRPLLQGSRLNYLELQRAGVEAILQIDAAAAITMQRQGIDLVIVGADRIARNGDTANKIGTYGLAILAAHHGIPFYVAAPRSTFDFGISSGDAIPIEERADDEVTSFRETRAAPRGAKVYNPAFDVTPGRLITAFITECGVVRPPYAETIPDLELRPFIPAPLARQA
jgi:methylthioribose-1-phosphate isomerase